MIDIQSELYTRVKNNMLTVAKNNGSTSYNSQPSVFPCWTLEVINNSVDKRYISSGEIENIANISVDINVYSASKTGKQNECNNIAKNIDSTLTDLGFTRVSYSPVPNFADLNIYRINSKYECSIDTNKNIYRR